MKTPIFCLVACLGASVVLAQGLGEAARKEQEKRKKAAEASAKAPTYGNAELLEAPKGKGTFSAVAARRAIRKCRRRWQVKPCRCPPPASAQARVMRAAGL